MTTIKALPGGRSNKPIWAFFTVNDRKVGGQLEKGALCQVEVGGVICGRRLLQNGAKTSGLHAHLESQHPEEWALYKTAKRQLDVEKMGAQQPVSDLYDTVEGNISMFCVIF